MDGLCSQPGPISRAPKLGDALLLLWQHRRAVCGAAQLRQRGGIVRREPTPDEIRADLMRRLEAIGRWRERQD
jgi:hypothetical protein